MVTGNQLLAHAIGDYILQSHWMAMRKRKSSWACLYHVLTYALPFLLLRPSLAAVAAIVGSHFVIDRWGLARFLVAFKNLFLSPPREYARLSDEIDMSTGYPKETPAWVATWLTTIADNTLHVLCNALALAYL